MEILIVPYAFALAIGALAGAAELWDRITGCDCGLCKPRRWR